MGCTAPAVETCVILVDSSIWIDHFRSRDDALFDLLSKELVLSHPFVTGEIALGHVLNRALIVRDLQKQQQAVIASDDEVLHLIEREKLFGTGIGYVDAHLISSVRLTAGSLLWTRDKRLHDIAKRLGIAKN
jgi:predicted nucleic acid-binding protein